MKFIKWILSLFKTKSKVVSIEPVPIEPPTPVNIPAVYNLTLEQICLYLYQEFEPHFGAKEKGNNTDKGGIIDRIILYMGGKLGWAWCAATVCYGVLRVCQKLGIKYPKDLYKGFSSQSLWHETNKKYIMSHPQMGFNLLGYAFVATNPKDKAHGHTGFCNGFIKNNWEVDTFEGNDSNQLKEDKRDARLASVFVNVAQAILDQYKLEKNLV